MIVCTEVENRQWRWIEPLIADTSVNLDFVRCYAKNSFERKLPFNLIELRGGLQAALKAWRTGAKAVVVHGPRLAAWFGLFAYVLSVKVPVIVYRFNFGDKLLPAKSKLSIITFAYSRLDGFVVSSRIERELYAKAFSLPVDKFDFVHWARWPPQAEPEMPLEKGDYICAVGGNARDYATLMEAARRLPQLRFALVVRPENLVGLTIPANVSTYVDMPLGHAMNIVLHSRFMVLPLRASDVPNGHDTIVAAMHLGKALIVTNSSGVQDYARDGDNAVLVTPGSVDDLTAKIETLSRDPEQCARLSQSGKRFAAEHCVPDRVAEHFRNWLREHGLETAEPERTATPPIEIL